MVLHIVVTERAKASGLFIRQFGGQIDHAASGWSPRPFASLFPPRAPAQRPPTLFDSHRVRRPEWSCISGCAGVQNLPPIRRPYSDLTATWKRPILSALAFTSASMDRVNRFRASPAPSAPEPGLDKPGGAALDFRLHRARLAAMATRNSKWIWSPWAAAPDGAHPRPRQASRSFVFRPGPVHRYISSSVARPSNGRAAWPGGCTWVQAGRGMTRAGAGTPARVLGDRAEKRQMNVDIFEKAATARCASQQLRQAAAGNVPQRANAGALFGQSRARATSGRDEIVQFLM